MADKINKVSTCFNKVKWTYIQILINIKRHNISPAKINCIFKETIFNNDIELFKIVSKYEYTMPWEKLEQFDKYQMIDWGDALYYAILHKRIKILKLLLSDRSLDVNIEKLNEGSIILNTKSYETPLINAIDGGNIEVVSMLLELPRILVNFPDIKKVVEWKMYHKLDYDYILMTPLIKAIKKGNLKIIKLLLQKKGIDVNLNSKIETPLMAATKTGNIEIVSLLLQKKGIDINNVRHSNFNTALNIAVLEGYYDIVCLLLKNGASKYIKNPKNEYTIHQRIKKNRCMIVKSLIDKDCVNLVNKCGETLLWRAVYTGDEEIVSMLLKVEGIYVNTVGGQEQWGNESCVAATPLYVAVHYRRKKIVLMLLEVEGIDVNKENKYGETPLYVAAWKGHTEIISMLLKVEGIDVNQAHNYGKKTPLWKAACGSHKEIVSMLLKVDGIDVNKSGKYGKTPLWVAAYNGYQEIVSMLRINGAI